MIFSLFKTKDTAETDFSKFFREASSREKKKVFLKAARAANEEQRAIVKKAGMAL